MPVRKSSEDREREELGKEIAGLLGPLVRDLRRALGACAGELGLTPAEAQALLLLERRESATTKEVATALEIDPANASTLITSLERRGLLRRRPDEDDRRRRIATLSAEGARTQRRLADCVAKRRPALRALTAAELRTFRDLLRRIAEQGA